MLKLLLALMISSHAQAQHLKLDINVPNFPKYSSSKKLTLEDRESILREKEKELNRKMENYIANNISFNNRLKDLAKLESFNKNSCN